MLPLPQVIELQAVPSEFAALFDLPVPRRPAAVPAAADLLDPAWAEQALRELQALLGAATH